MNSIKLDQESEQALILEEAYHLGYHKVENGCLQELLEKLNALITERERLARIDELERTAKYAGAWFRGDERLVNWVNMEIIRDRIKELSIQEAEL